VGQPMGICKKKAQSRPRRNWGRELRRPHPFLPWGRGGTVSPRRRTDSPFFLEGACPNHSAQWLHSVLTEQGAKNHCAEEIEEFGKIRYRHLQSRGSSSPEGRRQDPDTIRARAEHPHGAAPGAGVGKKLFHASSTKKAYSAVTRIPKVSFFFTGKATPIDAL